MNKIILWSILIFGILAVAVGGGTTINFLIKYNKNKIIREGGEQKRTIVVFREREKTLRTWYCVIAGVDTILLLMAIVSNAAAIFLAIYADGSKSWVIAFMLISLVSNSLRDAFGFSKMRKVYIKAARHMELANDKYEYAHEGTEKDLYIAYKEAQMIIEDYFE